ACQRNSKREQIHKLAVPLLNVAHFRHVSITFQECLEIWAYEPSPAHYKQQAGNPGGSSGPRCSNNRLIRSNPTMLPVLNLDVHPVTSATQHSKFDTGAEHSIELWLVHLRITLAH